LDSLKIIDPSSGCGYLAANAEVHVSLNQWRQCRIETVVTVFQIENERFEGLFVTNRPSKAQNSQRRAFVRRSSVKKRLIEYF
jgi:hypothetical protein